jgi:hypothetical protein
MDDFRAGKVPPKFQVAGIISHTVGIFSHGLGI